VPSENEGESVHTVLVYYDKPLRGIADFEGRPHLFQCEWDKKYDHWGETYSLTPVDQTALDVALRKEAIWERWATAHYKGRTTMKIFPLPEDRPAWDALEKELNDLLEVRARPTMMAEAEWTSDGSLFADGPFRVQWKPILR